jgi:acetyl-CoA carboxylase carboxyltransferase component
MTEREDLQELRARRALTEDAARPEAVAKRHERGGRTARENLADLIDPGSLVEYGRFAIAAQRARRDVDDLIARTPADGLIGGTATVGGRPVAVLSYDYTVLAGTQGALGHVKKDRLFEIIEKLRLPVVFFAEGGGGRPGDTDYPVVSSLHVRAFALWAALSGVVPRIAIVKGRCFAGNAVIAGCSDVIVATEDSSLGMGGPAMIAGGGLGDFHPDEIGPVSVQAPNGVVDVVVADEAEAVTVSKRLLGYFTGTVEEYETPDQTALRDAVPERERRAYKLRPIVDTLCAPAASPSCGRGSRPSCSPRSAGSRAARSGSSATTRWRWRARSLPARPTRPRGSCSCATRSACRSSRSSTRPGTWSGRRPRPRRSSAARRGCSSPGRRSACRCWRSCCGAGTGSAPRR